MGKGWFLTAWLVVAMANLGVSDVSAAARFADPAFQTRWQAGEAIAPNTWGPLALAKEGQREAYQGAPGGQRLVQYFDKGRMELTNPASGVVSSGLLASELLTGRMQLGDNAFEARQPAAIPLAGDPANTGPTYAMLQHLQAQLLAATPATAGADTTRALTQDGPMTTFPPGYRFLRAKIAGYDQPTGHNVPEAFVAFRTTVGLATVGLALSEPFWTKLSVRGEGKDVLIQVFERRVLTYTAANPVAFQVEMGNIGQQYYQWRYPAGAPGA